MTTALTMVFVPPIGADGSRLEVAIDGGTKVRDLSEEEVVKIRAYIDTNYKVEGDLRRLPRLQGHGLLHRARRAEAESAGSRLCLQGYLLRDRPAKVRCFVHVSALIWHLREVPQPDCGCQDSRV